MSIEMGEVVRFREAPKEGDPYGDVDPAMAYEFGKDLVRLGVAPETILDEFVVSNEVTAEE